MLNLRLEHEGFEKLFSTTWLWKISIWPLHMMVSHIFLCLILFLMFVCNNYPFRAFVTMIYWASTEVLLNFVAPLDSAVPSFDFDEINIFWTYGFDSVSIVFDSLSVSRSLHVLYFCIRFRRSFFWGWENHYTIHGFDSISIAQFPAIWFAQPKAP